MLDHDRAGEGPTVVLLHAGIADRRMWREQLPALAAAGYSALAPDLPGFGAQPTCASGPWEEVVATIDALDLERVALVGVSFGALVALRCALVAPERLWALALFGARAPEAEPSPTLAAAWDAEEEALERGDVEGAATAVAESWVPAGGPPGLREDVKRWQLRAFALQGGAAEIEEPPDPLTASEQLHDIDIPALVACGQHDMPDFHEGADALLHALPSAVGASVLAAAHLPPLETPEAFRALLLPFLAANRPGA